MKLLVIVDPHFRLHGPRSRKDKLFVAQQDKMDEIRGLCSHGVDGLIVTGDWFHEKQGHRVSYAVTNWLIETLRSWPCPIYGAMGNHDIQQTALNWRNQPIGALVQAEAFRPLWTEPDEENPTGRFNLMLRDGTGTGPKVQLTSCLYSYEYDVHPEQYYAVDRESDADLVISVPHGSLVPDDHNPPYHHTTPAKLAAAVPNAQRADLYVAGHEHDDLGVFAGPGFQCMNFGSLTRGNIQEYNLQRQVKVGVIETLKELVYGELRPRLTSLVLQSAKPATEVFYVDELKRTRLKNAEITQFAQTLRETFNQDLQVADPMDVLRVVMQAEQVTPAEEQRVIQYVQAARTELGE